MPYLFVVKHRPLQLLNYYKWKIQEGTNTPVKPCTNRPAHKAAADYLKPT